MMLKTSSNKKNPALGLFAFTLRKNAGLLILICIIALLFCPGYLLTYINDQLESFTADNPLYRLDYNDVMRVIAVLTTIATSLAAIFMNILNFSYLYTKRSSDVFHSIPLTRCELLFSRFFASYTFAVVPMLLIYGSAALIGLIPRVDGDLRILAVALCYNLVITLFTSAISLIFIICAGTAFDMVVSLACYGLGTILVGMVVLTMCDEVLMGYGSGNIRDVLCVLSPFVYCGYSLFDYCDTSPVFHTRYLCFFAVALVLTAAILCVCAFLYRRRKAEKAGDSYAYRFIYVICGLIVSFIAAFGVGLIFGEGYFGSISFFVFALAGALITAVIFGAVSYRGFKTVKSSLIIGASSYAVMIGLTVILATGGFGYSTRVPKVDTVKKATLTASGEDWVVSPELLTELHKKVVSDLDTIRDGNSNIVYGAEIIEDDVRYESEISNYNIYFTYELKNGGELKRYFYIPIDGFEKELLALYTCDERTEALLSNIEGDLDYVHFSQSFAEGQYDENYFHHSIELSDTQTRSLLKAYANDLRSATEASLRRTACDAYDISWEYEDPNEADHYIYNSISLFVEPHFEATRAVLDEIDLPTRVKELEEMQ